MFNLKFRFFSICKIYVRELNPLKSINWQKNYNHGMNYSLHEMVEFPLCKTVGPYGPLKGTCNTLYDPMWDKPNIMVCCMIICVVCVMRLLTPTLKLIHNLASRFVFYVCSHFALLLICPILLSPAIASVSVNWDGSIFVLRQNSCMVQFPTGADTCQVIPIAHMGVDNWTSSRVD